MCNVFMQDKQLEDDIIHKVGIYILIQNIKFTIFLLAIISHLWQLIIELLL